MLDHPLSVPLTNAAEPDPALIGAKASSLVRLRRAGFSVPQAACLTTHFFAPWVDALTASSRWRELETVLGDGNPDETRVARLGDELKSDVPSLALADAQRAALANVAATVPGPVAVRSSAPEEDLAGASFAGLYETELDVPVAMVEGAIRRCFASCLDARVLTYKTRQGIEAKPRFAAVVQTMVSSDVAGVAFSLNPVTNDFDEAVINATPGLGEALVSGEVDPHQWVIDKVGGETLESRFEGGDPCLDDGQRGAIRDAVCRVEALFEVPVDIEWAYARGELHLLQARPITTYVPLPRDMQTEPGQQRLLYVDPSLGEGITISGAVSPVTSDLVAKWLEWFGDYAFHGESFVGDITYAGGARLYGNLSNLLHLVDPRKIASGKDYVDTTLAELYATADFEPYRIEPPRNLTRVRLAWAVLKACVRMRPFFLAMLQAMVRPKAFQDRYRQDLAAFDQAVANADLEAPIVDLARELYAAVGRTALTATAPAMLMFIYGGSDAVPRTIDPDSEQQQRLVAAILGGGDELVLQMGLAMFRLARRLPAVEYDDLEALQSRVESRRMPEDFLAAWDDFIDRFGCRGPMEMDLANPKYGDDARLLLGQLATLAAEGGSDPLAVHADRVGGRGEAFAELSALLSRRKRRKLARAYRILCDFEGVRELPKHHMTLANRVIRQRLLATADRWVATGRLERREQIFELTLDDVSRAEADDGVDVQALVAERGAFYRDAKKRVRHFPHLIDSRGRILRPERNYRPGELTGVPVSPGIARGRVKVLDTPFDKALLPGDVLVAHTADPGWTPLFINAAAVLLEVGGELQHGALVAREYGKPCIAGIVGLTSMLEDGQRVEVDGDAGVVSIVDDERGTGP